MPHTLSAVHASLGAPALLASGVRADALAAAREVLAAAIEAGRLRDARVLAHGDALALLLSHDRGEAEPDVHRAAWDALAAATAVLRRSARESGRGLVAETFPGSLHGTGAACAEIVLTERPAGPLLLLLGIHAPVGVFNLPLARAFADPFTTPRLAHAAALRRGFNFEVHDLHEQRKTMFAAPGELHDLLACLSAADRHALKRIVTQDGAVVAVTSTDQRARIAGTAPADDAPLALVRSGGDAPALREALAPFLMPGFVYSAHGQTAVLTPLPVGGHGPLDADEPHALALGFEWAEGRLGEPVDLFAGTAFEAARVAAGQARSLLAAQGPFRPHAPAARPPGGLDPAAEAGTAERWTPL